MDPLGKFLVEQEKTHEIFRALAKETKRTGIAPDPNLNKRFGGFFVVLTHAPAICRKAEEVSRNVARTIPAIVYRAKNVHTTIGSFLYGEDFSPNNTGNPECFLEDLADAAKAVAMEAKNNEDRCAIDYREYLYTPVVLIAAGIPNIGFVNIVNALGRHAAERGITLKQPWGSHITLNRFSASAEEKQTGGFFKLVARAKPLGTSRPVALSVGYALQNPSTHPLFLAPRPNGHFTPYRTFPLCR